MVPQSRLYSEDPVTQGSVAGICVAVAVATTGCVCILLLPQQPLPLPLSPPSVFFAGTSLISAWRCWGRVESPLGFRGLISLPATRVWGLSQIILLLGSQPAQHQAGPGSSGAGASPAKLGSVQEWLSFGGGGKTEPSLALATCCLC